jgi:hypothetical protein
MDRMGLLGRVFEAFREGETEKLDNITIARVKDSPGGIGIQTDLADGVIRLLVWPSFERAKAGEKNGVGLMIIHSTHRRNPDWHSEFLEIHNNFQSCTASGCFSEEHKMLCTKILGRANEEKAAQQ